VLSHLFRWKNAHFVRLGERFFKYWQKGNMVTKATIQMLEYIQRRRVKMHQHAVKADADLNMARRIT